MPARNIHRQDGCSHAAIGVSFRRCDTSSVSAARPPRRTYLREWRQHRGKTLVQVAEQVGLTHGGLSKIERGLIGYNQRLLETLADLYGADVADLLIRNPLEPEAIWSIWDQAKKGERQQIVEIAKVIVNRRAG